ncbi:hypothetical protein Q5752_005497 [Cryptotrichosporon argae]
MFADPLHDGVEVWVDSNGVQLRKHAVVPSPASGSTPPMISCYLEMEEGTAFSIRAARGPRTWSTEALGVFFQIDGIEHPYDVFEGSHESVCLDRVLKDKHGRATTDDDALVSARPDALDGLGTNDVVLYRGRLCPPEVVQEETIRRWFVFRFTYRTRDKLLADGVIELAPAPALRKRERARETFRRTAIDPPTLVKRERTLEEDAKSNVKRPRGKAAQGRSANGAVARDRGKRGKPAPVGIDLTRGSDDQRYSEGCGGEGHSRVHS